MKDSQRKSRHGVLASDSYRVNIVVSEEMKKELCDRITPSAPTMSAVVRNFIHKGICDEKERQRKALKRNNAHTTRDICPSMQNGSADGQ
jgi:hypothetical protein